MNETNHEGANLLLTAVTLNKTSVIDLLIKQGASPLMSAKLFDEWNQTREETSPIEYVLENKLHNYYEIILGRHSTIYRNPSCNCFKPFRKSRSLSKKDLV